MIAAPRLRRLALLLVLLPQLCVLGIGHGVVLCIAPGGHVELEIAAGECCADTAARTSVADGDPVIAPNEPDCGSCSDLQIALDLRVSRAPGAGTVDPPTGAAAIPEQPPLRAAVVGSRHMLERRPERPCIAPHLSYLRSVLLRC